MKFQLISNFAPKGDQPKAIKALADNLKAGKGRGFMQKWVNFVVEFNDRGRV
ncbi:MAG: hypothetical protein KKE31_05710 [Planctomycetes bacterium]|nr:hypothetical protein [Planctomycetota bacterium]